MTLPEAPSLTSVHDAMIRAADATRQPPLVSYPFKLNQAHKDLCEKICARHGTTLPEFLRQCMAGLVRDYSYRDADDLAMESPAAEAIEQNAPSE